jgi:hypothetical protein
MMVKKMRKNEISKNDVIVLVNFEKCILLRGGASVGRGKKGGAQLEFLRRKEVLFARPMRAATPRRAHFPWSAWVTASLSQLPKSSSGERSLYFSCRGAHHCREQKPLCLLSVCFSHAVP